MKVYVAIQYHDCEDDTTVFGVSTSFDSLLHKAKENIMQYHPSFNYLQGTNWASLFVNGFNIDIMEEELE